MDNLQEKLPQRMCIICRCREAKPLLARYVLGQDGSLIYDAAQTKSGRGWYCCQKPDCRSKVATWRPRRKAGRVGR